MATDTAGSLTQNVPPNPQQRSAPSVSTTSTPAPARSRRGCVLDAQLPQARGSCRAPRSPRRPRRTRSGGDAGGSARRGRSASSTTRSDAARASLSLGVPAKSSGQWSRIIVAHEPDGTTIGPSSGPRKARRVVRATRRAAATNPAFQAGCPQHVARVARVTGARRRRGRGRDMRSPPRAGAVPPSRWGTRRKPSAGDVRPRSARSFCPPAAALRHASGLRHAPHRIGPRRRWPHADHAVDHPRSLRRRQGGVDDECLQLVVAGGQAGHTFQ